MKENDLLHSPNSCDPFLLPFDLVRLARKLIELDPRLPLVIVAVLDAAISQVPGVFLHTSPTSDACFRNRSLRTVPKHISRRRNKAKRPQPWTTPKELRGRGIGGLSPPSRSPPPHCCCVATADGARVAANSTRSEDLSTYGVLIQKLEKIEYPS